MRRFFLRTVVTQVVTDVPIFFASSVLSSRTAEGTVFALDLLLRNFTATIRDTSHLPAELTRLLAWPNVTNNTDTHSPAGRLREVPRVLAARTPS